MNLPKFSELIALTNREISEEIYKTEKIIFNLRFNRATQQTFKNHELKYNKCKLAQLKTLIRMRLPTRKFNEENTVIENNIKYKN